MEVGICEIGKSFLSHLLKSHRQRCVSPRQDGAIHSIRRHDGCCIFKKKKQIHDWNDVEGADTLRWEDQQNLRKFIEGGPVEDANEEGQSAKGKGAKSKAKTKGVNEDGDESSGEYAIENAKSSRSTCKSCNEKIDKGQVRISTMVAADGGRFRGKVPQWRHAKCFLSMGHFSGPLASLPGWDTLTSEDQAQVQTLAKPSAAAKRKEAVKESKATTAKEPKAGRGKKTQAEQDETVEKPNKRRKQNDGKEAKATDGVGTTVAPKKVPKAKGPVTAGKQTKLDPELESKLEKQSKSLWEIKDKLREHVSIVELREMLAANNQDTTGSEYDVRERCADGMMFGVLAKCPLCEGYMEYQGGSYRCRGYLSAWSKCTFTTLTPERTTAKWEIGEACDNDYLLGWYKTQSKMKGERLLVPASQAEPTIAEKPRNCSESFLEGCEFAVIGRLSITHAKLKEKIEKAGGRVRSGATGIGNTVTCVVTTENVVEDEKHRRDLEYARAVPIVKEQYLLDCFEKKEKLPVDGYRLEIGSKPSIVKVKVKGRGAVHEDSGLQDTGHIVEEGKVIYTTTLNRSELATGINSFYVLQLIEEDAKKTVHLYRKWGRVGNDRIGGDKIEKLSKADGIKEFKRLFKEKTGNDWESWVNREDFEKQPGKFYPLDIDYGVDEVPKPDKALVGSKSRLHPRVINLMKMLFDLETYKAAMMEFEINMSEMPLGKLSKRHIERGYEVLTEIQNILKEAVHGPREQGLLVDASNRFFTLIPTVHPMIISDEQTLKSKIHMLDALRDIEIASEFLGSKVEEGTEEEDPLDTHYKKLHCDIRPIPHDSGDFKLVEKYLKQTHAPTHTDWALELEDVFAVDREGEADSFAPFKMCLDNHMLLWHGSRTTNYVGILSQGLRIAPPEAPVTGYMFGKGLYFADLVSKSAQYCYTTKKNPTGLMLLSEVALGKTNNLKSAKYMEKPLRGTNSTLGLGKTKPLETEFKKFEGDVTVPCGQPVPSGIRSDLMYNEYIVYDTAQVKLRFLLKVNFKHKR
ncbi:poly [ADP-ribose] polymerase 1 isoform X2 [Physcomitrium patens]|uniref:Poly [ADP-ribose] polymerase n=1 Tax=Physcomitrium patens TaxID=3218 RepID=A0A7I4ECK1_PHYPA|nr:poly [ADP-ribose] polymerase 1-like isoform X2 [Physcomitrium patens]|eukprot:XP_024382940.1 poly [ADP-ribose] polymerase 1-like isoform X2 [Physcomitrella patens]